MSEADLGPDVQTRCVVVRGKAGSGKSTVALGIQERLGWERVDYDAEMIRAYHRYGLFTEDGRELARREGRIAAGAAVRAHIAAGRSVVCDADVRDARELAELLEYDGQLPARCRVLVICLTLTRGEARRRKLTPQWNEFRVNPRQAARYFEQLWNYPFDPINAEREIKVGGKAIPVALEEACAALGAAH
jgi:predicted kinase